MKATFWDKRSKSYEEDIKKHDSLYIKTIDSTVSLLTESDVVLDFACASGEYSLDIAPHVQRLQGIDLSLKMIELANQKARDRQVANVSFGQIVAFDQSLESDSFSAVIAFNIIHLLEDAPRVLARLNDLLAAKGLLISKTPCLGERNWFVRSMINLIQKLGFVPPVRNLTIAELESLVSNGNFEILESKMWDQENGVQWLVARKK